MMKEKHINFCLGICFLIIIDFLIVSLINVNINTPSGELRFYAKMDSNLYIQMFYGEDETFSDQKNIIKYYTGGRDKKEIHLQYDISSDYIKLFFTPGWSELLISDMRIVGGKYQIFIAADQLQNPYAINDISITSEGNNGIRVKSEGDDAWIVMKLSEYDTVGQYTKANAQRLTIYKLLFCMAVDLLIAAFLIAKKEGYMDPPVDCSTWCAKLSIDQKLIVLALILIALSGAMMIPYVYCPDEIARQLLSDYIYKNNSLPTGNEPETIIYMWGFSYALRPYLPSIINAVFMKIVSIFTSSENALFVASRMCSVLALTGTAIFSLKTGNLLFRKRSSANLMAIIVCFTPQVIFLGMYQNNDALSIFAISMEIYFLVKGHRNTWDGFLSISTENTVHLF